jgi:hypothetical protein
LRLPTAPRPSVRILGWISILLLPFVTLEIAAALYFTIRDGGYISVYERLGRRSNTYVTAFNTSPGCSYLNLIYPHPYLAHAHDIYVDPACRFWINSSGLMGRDYPLRRDPGRFTILLTGGSVAGQLGQTSSSGPLFLEAALNRCFKPPRGERFVVLNGGAEFRLHRWVGLSVDAQYSRVKGILGAGGLSAQLGESDLGGIAARFKLIVGR